MQSAYSSPSVPNRDPLFVASRKLKARFASLILVPGTALYMYICLFVFCLAVVFFAEGEQRDTFGWNVMVTAIFIFGGSGVIRVAGAKRAVYKAVMKDNGDALPTPDRAFTGGIDQVLFRLLFALIVMLTTVSSIVVMLLIILGDWSSVFRMSVLLIPCSILCRVAWSHYVQSLLNNHSAGLFSMYREMETKVKRKFDELKSRNLKDSTALSH